MSKTAAILERMEKKINNLEWEVKLEKEKRMEKETEFLTLLAQTNALVTSLQDRIDKQDKQIMRLQEKEENKRKREEEKKPKKENEENKIEMKAQKMEQRQEKESENEDKKNSPSPPSSSSSSSSSLLDPLEYDETKKKRTANSTYLPASELKSILEVFASAGSSLPSSPSGSFPQISSSNSDNSEDPLLVPFKTQENMKKVLLIQRTARKMMAQRLVKQELMCNNIVDELLETENVYVASLELVITHFETPLSEMAEKGGGIITQEEVKGIFSELKVIYLYNQLFLADLLQRKAEGEEKNWMDNKYSDIISRITQYLKSYTAYYNNYNNSLATLSKCTERSKFRDFLEQKENIAKEPLSSLLIRPIQRVPKYVLLLRDWMKHLPFTHPDFNPLKKAEDEMIAIARDLNERVRDSGVFMEILRVNYQLSPPILDFVQPHRRFVREAPLGFRPAPKAKIKSRWGILCNDVLLITRPPVSPSSFPSLSRGNPNQFASSRASTSVSRPSLPPSPKALTKERVYKREVMVLLKNSTAWSFPDDDPDPVRKKEREMGFFAFTIDTPTKSFQFFSDSPEERQNWIQMLNLRGTSAESRIQSYRQVSQIKNSRRAQSVTTEIYGKV